LYKNWCIFSQEKSKLFYIEWSISILDLSNKPNYSKTSFQVTEQSRLCINLNVIPESKRFKKRKKISVPFLNKYP